MKFFLLIRWRGEMLRFLLVNLGFSRKVFLLGILDLKLKIRFIPWLWRFLQIYFYFVVMKDKCWEQKYMIESWRSGDYGKDFGIEKEEGQDFGEFFKFQIRQIRWTRNLRSYFWKYTCWNESINTLLQRLRKLRFSNLNGISGLSIHLNDFIDAESLYIWTNWNLYHTPCLSTFFIISTKLFTICFLLRVGFNISSYSRMAQLLASKGKGPMVVPTRGRNGGKISASLAMTRDSYPVVRTETVKVASLDIKRRIQQFAWTMIGRVWNPRRQNMEDLIRLLPKILKMEGKVDGADLGMGKFQLNFQSEEDIQEVLCNEPYHFDSWMVSLVRWEPIVASTYPSTLTFWVQVVGIPFHYWAEDTIRMVGNALGCVKEVDEETGCVKVMVNGFKPLIFRTIIPFDNGDEIEVSLVYEKLTGVCNHCFHISHDIEHCPELRKNEERKRNEVWENGVSSSHQGGRTGSNKFQKDPMKRGLDVGNINNQPRHMNWVEGKNNLAPPQKRTDSHFQENWDNKRGKVEISKLGMYKWEKAETSRSINKEQKVTKGMIIPGETTGGQVWPKPLYQSKMKINSGTQQNDLGENEKPEMKDLTPSVVQHNETQSGNEEVLKMGNVAPASPIFMLEDDDFLLEDGESNKSPLSLEMEKELEKYSNELMKGITEEAEQLVPGKSISANEISKNMHNKEIMLGTKLGLRKGKKEVINEMETKEIKLRNKIKLANTVASNVSLTHVKDIKESGGRNRFSEQNKKISNSKKLESVGDITVGLKKIGIKENKLILSRNHILLKGANSKKRNLLIFTSPRKGMVSKKLNVKFAGAVQGKDKEGIHYRDTANKKGMVALPEPPNDP